MTTVRHHTEIIKSPLAGCPRGDFPFSSNNVMTKLIDKNVKYHIVYKTTNLCNGKWYIGKHSTYNLNDGYLGSGSHLKSAIRKYGKENFQREIICFCDSEQEAYEKEAELVTMEIVKNPMTYNKMLGGEGSNKRVTNEELKEHHRESCRKWYEANRENARESSRKWKEENRERHLENCRKWNETNRESVRENQHKWYEKNKLKNSL